MANTNRWNNDLLESMRMAADPEADQVVAEIIDKDGLDTVVELIRHLVKDRDVVPHELPPRVHQYFQDTAHLPAWADPELIERGERVFEQHGPEMVASLFFISLPTAYAAAKGAKALALTARITRHINRRIFRTAQFVMDVMNTGGLGPEGMGVRTTQKVRLIHASIRHYLLHRPDWQEHWNMDWGMPLNQEDLAGTMLDFSVGVMRGLDRINIRLDPEEKEAYLHVWKVVGHILGVRPELMPEDVADAFVLANTITGRQWKKSAEGEELAADLVDYLQFHIPGTLFDGIVPTALRRFATDEVADILNVPPANWTVHILNVQIWLFDFADRNRARMPWLQHWFRVLTRNLIGGLVLLEEGGKRWEFDIPPGLKTNWRMR